MTSICLLVYGKTVLEFRNTVYSDVVLVYALVVNLGPPSSELVGVEGEGVGVGAGLD